MTVVRLFAAAADSAGVDVAHVSAPTLGAALDAVAADARDDFPAVLAQCSVLLDGARTEDRGTPVTGTAVIDVLPPFAGG